MSKLPQLTKLRRDDLGSNLPPWMDKVIYTVNRLADSVYTALNSGLTPADNLKAQILTLTIATSDLPYKASVNLPVTDLILTNIYEKSGSRVDFTTAVWPDWVYDASNGTVIVYNISGLTAGKTYVIRLLALGE